MDKNKTLGTLNSRQVCSIESTARMNPDTKVYLLFVDVEDLEPSPFIDALRQFKNIEIAGIDLKSFGDGTPFEDFTREEKVSNSSYPVTHASDFLRLLVLWK